MASVNADDGTLLGPELAMLKEYKTSSQLGVLFSSTLFGVICVQVYLYHVSKRIDSVWVCWVFAVELVHTVLLWIYFITTGNRSPSNPFEILALSPALAFVYFTSSLLGTTVQAYYASRLYLLSGSLLLALFSWVGSAARLSLTIVGAVDSFRASSIIDYMQRYGWCMKGVFGVSVIVDVWNTIAICVIFGRRRRGQQHEMVHVIDKLSMWAVETGLITSVLAGAMLILILLNRYALIPAFAHIYPNMFSLSLLMTLNARDGIWKTLLRSRYDTQTTVPSFNVGSRSFWRRAKRVDCEANNPPHVESCGESDAGVLVDSPATSSVHLEVKPSAKGAARSA